MRILFPFFPLIFLVACSKAQPPATVAPPASRMETKKAAAILENTSAYADSAVLAASASIMAAGSALPAKAAERCWTNEKQRPEVARACLLAWSMAAEKSEVLEHAAATDAAVSRISAIAAIKSVTALKQVGAGGLVDLLRQLEQDPVWLRASAVKIWLDGHAVPGIAVSDSIARVMMAGKLRLPADFRLAYHVLSSLKPAEASAMLDDHCALASTGELGARCWRFLSAFSEARPGERIPAEIEARIPAIGPGWQLFQAAMPSRSRLLTPYLK